MRTDRPTDRQTDRQTDIQNLDVEALARSLKIIQADGSALNVIGSSVLYLEAENMKGRRRIECAVIEGNGAREILISLEYLKRWHIVHETFPKENLDDYLSRKFLIKRPVFIPMF